MNTENRRQHIRFDPDENALAVIHIDGEEDNSLIGLLRDESHEGCGAVFHQEHFPYEEGDTVELKVHELNPIHSEISWTKPLDDRLIKVGFHYGE